MGSYGETRPDFYDERTRILEALALDENRYILLRLIGALAFRTHCPQFGYLQEALGRVFTDIDFASYQRFFKDIQRLFGDLGYQEDKMVSRLFGEHRMLFHDPLHGRHIDVFFDQLHFSHTLPLAGRLEAESLTLPLAELLLEKAQIVQINEKDLIDAVMLLREHPIGQSDEETINARIITRLTSTDWGLWRTVTGNLALLRETLPRYAQLSDEDRRVVAERIDRLQHHIDEAPKSAKWKIRAAIGERVKWYEDVEDLAGR
jgi:hypothetical protein